MGNAGGTRTKRMRTYIIDVLETERQKLGFTEEEMGKALGLKGRRGYSHMRRDAKEPPKYETLVAAVTNLPIVFEHEGLVFGSRERVTPSFLKESLGTKKKRKQSRV
jgi:hypothetical protein